ENAGPWELGEGLRATSRGLVAVDLLAGKLYRLGLEHDREPAALLASVPFPLGAVAPIQDSDAWIAAADTGVAVLNRDGTVEWLARPEDDAPTRMRMN